MSVPAKTLKPLEECLRCKFLPAITYRSSFTDTERKLLALPIRFGGLSVTIPADLAKQQFQACTSNIAPLSNQIFYQQYQYTADIQQRQKDPKREALTAKHEKQSQIASEIHKSLPEKQKRSVDILKEKGASNWLNTLPILEHGFALSKGAFRDALCLRYGWQPSRLPSYCTCRKKFTIDHAMSCPCGGLPTIRHNEIRDLTANLIAEVCSCVGIEPMLQPLSGEQIGPKSAITEDGARLDIKANGFWESKHETTSFDVRIFNPLAKSNSSMSLTSCYGKHENEKCRNYEARIREIEHSTFTPLVLSTSGTIAPATKVTYNRLASLIAEKYQQPYNLTFNWLRCKLSFSLIRSAVMCLRGANPATIVLQISQSYQWILQSM